MLELGLLCKSFRPHFINDTKRKKGGKKRRLGKGKCLPSLPQTLLAQDETLQLPRGERVKIAFFLYFPRGTVHLLSGRKADKPGSAVLGFIASCVPHPWFWSDCGMLSQSYCTGPNQNNFSKFSPEDKEYPITVSRRSIRRTVGLIAPH